MVPIDAGTIAWLVESMTSQVVFGVNEKQEQIQQEESYDAYAASL
jgi:hypothetical protein